MVTAPAAAEVDEAWVTQLLDAGMNVLRINGAHEGVAEWRHIVETSRRVAAARKIPLRILVDLPGPKVRTVATEPGPRVERWKPERDDFGRVTAPCRVVIRADDSPVAPKRGPTVSMPGELFRGLARGDELTFLDARCRKRRLVIVETGDCECVAHLERTAYVVPETRVDVQRGTTVLGSFLVQHVAERPHRWRLAVGDRFRLEPCPLEPSAAAGDLPVVGCSFAQAVALLKPGARVLLDDGKFEGVAEERSGRGMLVRVRRAPGGAAMLGVEKGVNLPDTSFAGSAFGPDDETTLEFALAFADMVGASFIRSASGVQALYARLDGRAPANFGVVLKIETAAAFAELPSIMLAAMKGYPLGVMIARGDLAVEAGFQRLAELQEEMLWLCEAAHIPAIWATQVLDHLAHEGIATRAEVTDAEMSVRAECVMLNKGPCIHEAVAALVDILRRMEHHQYKKRSLYRKLHLSLPPNGAEPETCS
jgi:pyruvate kinase